MQSILLTGAGRGIGHATVKKNLAMKLGELYPVQDNSLMIVALGPVVRKLAIMKNMNCLFNRRH